VLSWTRCSCLKRSTSCWLLIKRQSNHSTSLP
jgi:hypothetical protein